MSQNKSNHKRDEIEKLKAMGGKIRMIDAINAGISRKAFYELRDDGVIESLSRGIYRLTDLPSLSNPDIIAATLRAPHSVICLVSALAFHEITTQIPSAVDLAVPAGKTIPRIKRPPVRIHRIREPYFSVGIEERTIDGYKIRIYDPEKTLIDCFKFRNQLGMEVVLEALKLYRSRMRVKVSTIMKYARMCRVEKIIRPYFEAVL
jgi:predicted transcriptional regulator of viral defense system